MRQAEYLAPHTRRTLQAAGVGPGTRVLDLGAGMGDVSLLAAELGAEVVGVERDPATLERARARIAGRSVELVHGVLPEIEVTGTFDVICGRLILMYLPDPVAVLRRVSDRYLAPDGRLAFVEYDLRAALSVPAPALGHRCLDTMRKVFEGARCATDLGLRLPDVFAAAGFARPSLEAMLWTATSDDDIGFEMMADVLRAIQPIAAQLGLAGEIDPDLATLPDRLRATTRAEGTMLGPVVVGAAARRAL